MTNQQQVQQQQQRKIFMTKYLPRKNLNQYLLLCKDRYSDELADGLSEIWNLDFSVNFLWCEISDEQCQLDDSVHKERHKKKKAKTIAISRITAHAVTPSSHKLSHSISLISSLSLSLLHAHTPVLSSSVIVSHM